MPQLKQITLSNYRSSSFATYNFEQDITVITAPNGSGKTNLLESISILSPGRGLRNAELVELLKSNAPEWAVVADINGYKIATGAAQGAKKRIIKIDDEPQKNANILADYVSCIWLTPQMDGVFLADKAHRRRFFDRIIYNFDTAHATRVSVYENAMRERLRLLKKGVADNIWLKSLERKMAEYGTAIAAARVEVVGLLQNAIMAAPTSFLKPQIAISGKYEALITTSSALALEEQFADDLYNNRGIDAASGRSLVGVHRTDFVINNPQKNMPAYMCSTGEQKAMLTAIILASAALIKSHKNKSPILLLDEVAAHLDEHKRAELFEEIKQLGCQTFLTGTDAAIFDNLSAKKITITP
jgi:DNA replication and repair protein RecF